MTELVESSEVKRCESSDFFLSVLTFWDSLRFYVNFRPKGTIYGFGRFVRQDGTQIFGLFRNGQLVHGITLTNRSASVAITFLSFIEPIFA